MLQVDLPFSNVQAPEPATLTLMGRGLAGLVHRRYRGQITA